MLDNQKFNIKKIKQTTSNTSFWYWTLTHRDLFNQSQKFPSLYAK